MADKLFEEHAAEKKAKRQKKVEELEARLEKLESKLRSNRKTSSKRDPIPQRPASSYTPIPTPSAAEREALLRAIVPRRGPTPPLRPLPASFESLFAANELFIGSSTKRRETPSSTASSSSHSSRVDAATRSSLAAHQTHPVVERRYSTSSLLANHSSQLTGTEVRNPANTFLPSPSPSSLRPGGHRASSFDQSQVSYGSIVHDPYPSRHAAFDQSSSSPQLIHRSTSASLPTLATHFSPNLSTADPHTNPSPALLSSSYPSNAISQPCFGDSSSNVLPHQNANNRSILSAQSRSSQTEAFRHAWNPLFDVNPTIDPNAHLFDYQNQPASSYSSHVGYHPSTEIPQGSSASTSHAQLPGQVLPDEVSDYPSGIQWISGGDQGIQDGGKRQRRG